MRRQLLRFIRSFQHRFQRQRFVSASDHENHQCGVVHSRRRQRNAFGEKLADPVAHYQPTIIPQSFRSGKEGKRVPFVSHAEKDKVKPGGSAGGQMEVGTQNPFVFARGLLRVRVFALNTMHLLRFQRSLGDHGLQCHSEIAIGMSWFHVALIAEEQLHFIPRQLPAERIANQQRIQGFRSGSAGEANAERAIGLRCGARRLDEFFRGAPGDCRGVLQDPYVGVCAIVRHAARLAFTTIPISRSKRAVLT